MDLNGWIAEFGGVMDKHFVRNYYVRRNQNFSNNKQDFIDSCNNRDVYQCAYHYKNEDFASCDIMGDPYLDFDCEDIKGEWKQLITEVKYVLNYLETAMSVPPEELHIYFSGSKGFHIVIPAELVGLKPSSDLNQSFRYFAMGIAFQHSGKNVKAVSRDFLDLKIYDRRRLFRLPNTINAKSGHYKVPVTIDQIYDYSYEEMMDWASRPREEQIDASHYRAIAEEGFHEIIELGKDFECAKNGRKRRHHSYPRKKTNEIIPLLPCAEQLLKTGAPKGVRNHSCFALASSLLQAGHKLDEVYEMIGDWNERNEEPLSDHEIQVTVNSAATSYDNGMTVGCGKYRDLDLCLKDCPLLQD